VPGKIGKIYGKKKEEAKFAAIGNEKAKRFFSQLLDLRKTELRRGAGLRFLRA